MALCWAVFSFQQTPLGEGEVMIAFYCIVCKREYSVRDDLQGRRVKCQCGRSMRVPDADPPPFEEYHDEPVSVTQSVHVHHAGRAFPHALHAVLTLFTCGVWLPVWVVCYVLS